METMQPQAPAPAEIPVAELPHQVMLLLPEHATAIETTATDADAKVEEPAVQKESFAYRQGLKLGQRRAAKAARISGAPADTTVEKEVTANETSTETEVKMLGSDFQPKAEDRVVRSYVNAEGTPLVGFLELQSELEAKVAAGDDSDWNNLVQTLRDAEKNDAIADKADVAGALHDFEKFAQEKHDQLQANKLAKSAERLPLRQRIAARIAGRLGLFGSGVSHHDAPAEVVAEESSDAEDITKLSDAELDEKYLGLDANDAEGIAKVAQEKSVRLQFAKLDKDTADKEAAAKADMDKVAAEEEAKVQATFAELDTDIAEKEAAMQASLAKLDADTSNEVAVVAEAPTDKTPEEEAIFEDDALGDRLRYLSSIEQTDALNAFFEKSEKDQEAEVNAWVATQTKVS